MSEVMPSPLDQNSASPQQPEQKSATALLLIDVINDFDFPEAHQLLHFAIPMAQQIKALAERAREAGVPVIYVNDNFGKWRSDFRAQIAYCSRDESLGASIAKTLHPHESDYFVLKPKHSAFFSTTLDTLLGHLEVETLILTGVAANICVLFTANDAYMRDYKLIVPKDCVAANTDKDTEFALSQMQRILRADTSLASEFNVLKLSGLARPKSPSTEALA